MVQELSHIYLLLKRLLLVFASFTFSRFLFFAFNYKQFTGSTYADIFQSFAAGIIFDTSAIVYTFGLFILLQAIPINTRNNSLYQSFLKGYFIFVLTVCTLLNLVDVGFYPFSGRRSGLELLAIKKDIAQHSVSYLFTYWYLFFALIVIVFFSALFYPKLKTVQKIVTLKQFLLEFLAFIFIAVLCFLGARGGWNLKPITAFDAARFADSKLINLTINTPFQMLVSTQQVTLDEKNFMPEETAKKLFDPIKINLTATDSVPKNIVLVIVESLGKEYVGFYNHGKGFTPFLDSLMQHSLVFTHAYANGKRSIEGLPSIIASIPSLMNNDYNNSIYQSNRLRGIGDYLKEAGFDASFYHGGKNGTMSFDNFIAITNSGKYFGMNEYPEKEKDFDGNWGIFDEPYLQYFARELEQKHQPFFSTIFTLSSHHPYQIPESKRHLFTDGTLPIHKSIRYADYSLQKFFETVKKMPWYSNTVFIITADHSAENETPYYQTEQGRYEIPLIVFEPGKNQFSEDTLTTQHTNLLPFILSRNYPKKYFSFGNFSGNNCFAVQYFNGIYQFIQYPFVYQFNGEKGTAFYNLNSDSLMKNNLIDKSSLVKSKMDSLVKSFIQQYNSALIHNKTHIE